GLNLSGGLDSEIHARRVGHRSRILFCRSAARWSELYSPANGSQENRGRTALGAAKGDRHLLRAQSRVPQSPRIPALARSVRDHGYTRLHLFVFVCETNNAGTHRRTHQAADGRDGKFRGATGTARTAVGGTARSHEESHAARDRDAEQFPISFYSDGAGCGTQSAGHARFWRSNEFLASVRCDSLLGASRSRGSEAA